MGFAGDGFRDVDCQFDTGDNFISPGAMTSNSKENLPVVAHGTGGRGAINGRATVAAQDGCASARCAQHWGHTHGSVEIHDFRVYLCLSGYWVCCVFGKGVPPEESAVIDMVGLAQQDGELGTAGGALLSQEF